MRLIYCIMVFDIAGLGLPLYADQVLAPATDGTLIDGGGFGIFDGIADGADWSFNQSSYEGAISVSHESNPPVEHRVVFEFNLSSVAMPPPVVARFKFKLRGAARFPAETAVVQVLAYPSDLIESLSDFSLGPAALLGEVSVAPFQPQTQFDVDVTDQVNLALASASKRVALRLQMSPQVESAQAFFDALDSDPLTKPNIVISAPMAGDFDHDGDLDVNDYSRLTACLSGPGAESGTSCATRDLNSDSFVDLLDVQIFEELLTSFGD